MSKDKVTVLFTRVSGLATVVWDPEKDCTLAHFNKQGLLATSNANVIETLRAMGYREVTAEQLLQAGLTVPNEDDVPDAPVPGQGYQAPSATGSMEPGAAMAGKPDRKGADPNLLFQPDPMQPEPPGDAGRRKLVT